jgi:hypothetical protein
METLFNKVNICDKFLEKNKFFLDAPSVWIRQFVG